MEVRIRSRASREANDVNSFGSYSSASDDESYESISDQKFGYNRSTEYESNTDGSSYSVMSEDEPPTPNTTDIYESNGFGGRQGFHTVSPDDSRDSISGSSVSISSSDEFDDQKEDEFENSFGDFEADEFVYDKNKNRNNKDSGDESRSINSGEEDVKMSEQDDDSFWKRSGHDKETGNFEDDESKNSYGDDSSRSSSHSSLPRSGSSSGSGSFSNDEGSSRDFDDSDRFNDEAAFPSITRMPTEESADRTELSSERSGASGGGGGRGDVMEKIKGWFAKCGSLLDCSEVFRGKFKWYIIGGIIVIFIGIILAIALPKNGNDGNDDSATKKPWVVSRMPPTATPVIPSTPTPTPMPSLPPGQMMDVIIFFVLIPNGKVDSITEEELEIEFSAAFDILAPQVLFNTTELKSENMTDSGDIKENQTIVEKEEEGNDSARLRGRRRRGRRKLEALSVKTPCLVDVIEIVCPDNQSILDTDLCVRGAADVVLITDDGTIDFDYYAALQVAIEDGELQEASDATGSNLTIVTLDIIPTPSPTTTPSPTNSPGPTASSAPTSSCYDRESNCEAWANKDPSECGINPEYMNFYCTKACGACITDSPTTASPTISPTASPTNLPTVNSTSASPTESPAPTSSPTFYPTSSAIPTSDDGSATLSPTSTPIPCIDKNDGCVESLESGGCIFTKCAVWASEGECNTNSIYMLDSCAKSCNKCGVELTTESPTPVENSGSEPILPAPTVAPTNNMDCIDENVRCAGWAADDQCSSNPGYMFENCKLSCNACQSEEDNYEQPTTPPCIDNKERCAEWSADDQCSSNPGYMLENCKLSCSSCQSEEDNYELLPTPPCIDNKEQCAEWAAANQCSSNPGYMLENCKLSCNVCQSGEGNEQAPGGDPNQAPGDDNQASEDRNQVSRNPSPEDDNQVSEGGGQASLTPSPCVDDNDRCTEWAADDQCSSNPGYMLENCKLSCNDCQSVEGNNQLPTTLSCIDDNNRCAEWAADDQCSSNPGYMLENCKLSCGTCMALR